MESGISRKLRASPKSLDFMLGENGTGKKGGEKRSINPTHLVILIKNGKIKSVLFGILQNGKTRQKIGE
ncbi:hypothetical protein D8B45_00530 [Candidatus Gracilibacteria bacterium]|nr:MAG: hypothetical protein D8B45_00530 [Candidatus Gracilibacteria bacterium]